MTPIKDWFKSLVSNDARKNSRRKTPPLAAYFWDGGNPVAHTVQNISPTGFYLATTERWLLGTLIMMTLQRTSGDPSKPDCSVIVMSKVVRYGEDGVGFAFIPVETASSNQQSGPGSHAADKKTLDKFLHLLASDES
ncbi:MAG: PilZ domain-containing protein [Silvibacterium sp.]